jgi:hypothetical protein
MPAADPVDRALRALRRRLRGAAAVVLALVAALAVALGWLVARDAGTGARARAARAAFVTLTGLPDAALVPGAPALRHPALATPAEVGGDDPGLPLPFAGTLLRPRPTGAACVAPTEDARPEDDADPVRAGEP